jgi:RimJ/RimL family protein N-acetyltransferase
MRIELESERLRMTQVAEADWEFFHRVHTTAEVMRYISDPLTDEEIRARFDVRLLPWDKEQPHWLSLVIREKSSGAAAGITGMRPEWMPYQQAEVGFLLLPEFQGRGYAGESLSSVISFAFGECRFHKLKALVTGGNEPSCRALERVGFQREGVIRDNFQLYGQWKDDVLFGLLEHEARLPQAQVLSPGAR